MENIYALENLLLKLDDEGGYFLRFLKTKQLEAGLFRLGPDEMDMQEPHTTDEIDCVIKGEG